MGLGTDLKRVEAESFAKSFLLFFVSLGVMISVITYVNYKNELEHFDKELLAKMQLCNYSLNCKEFKVSFVPKAEQLTYVLLKTEKEVSSLFPVEGGDDFYLKLFYTQDAYHDDVHFLHEKAFVNLVIWLLVIIVLSILFSLYALYPLRNALLLTREFVKDILHDVNTPISTMRLNLSLLHKEIGENKKLLRVERSIENILLLQENLRDYLHSSKSEKEFVNLKELIDERVHLIENSYPSLGYSVDITLDEMLLVEKKFFTRIVDNLLSNSSKYNKQNGKISIVFDEHQKSLKIIDTGKGIKNPKRVFERFYKEHERGVGIGLHIVKKLCAELGIGIELETVLGEGTTVQLGLEKIIKNK
jgi:signal transduction histidine kinase